ncbi:hypothetical protein FRC09_017752 [Ceratobasidium sp. 395]|nr:hypothetical protein FRC09_017752 [Ceratobasidium sp. 395]
MQAIPINPGSLMMLLCPQCGYLMSAPARSAAYSGASTVLAESGPESTAEGDATDNTDTSNQQRQPPRMQLDQFHGVMSLFGRGPGFTLGEFFQFLLDPETALTESESATLTSWFKGRTKTGLSPVDTVAAMYLHPKSRTFTNGQLRHSDFTDLAPQSDTPLYLDKYPHKAKLLPSSSSYRERFKAREGLEELFARSTLAIVDMEAEKLCSPETGLSRGAGVTWDMFSTYSLAKEHPIVQKQAPVS